MNTVAGDFLRNNPHAAQAALKSTVHAVQLHGPDPATRKQAAAHEAGHAIWNLINGYGVREVKIHRESAFGMSGWGGATYKQKPFEVNAVTADLTDAQLVLMSLDSSAGIAGELVAGLLHPASSHDEGLLVSVLTRELALRWGVPELIMFTLVMGAAASALKDHLQAFNSIREALSKHKALPGSVVNALAVEVSTKDMPVELRKLVDMGKAYVWEQMLAEPASTRQSCRYQR